MNSREALGENSMRKSRFQKGLEPIVKRVQEKSKVRKIPSGGREDGGLGLPKRTKDPTRRWTIGWKITPDLLT